MFAIFAEDSRFGSYLYIFVYAYSKWVETSTSSPSYRTLHKFLGDPSPPVALVKSKLIRKF